MQSRRSGTKYAITPSQIRAARALVDWSRERLSVESTVPMRTLARVETDEVQTRPETLELLRVTLEAAGVIFIKVNGGGPGVRLRKRTAR